MSPLIVALILTYVAGLVAAVFLLPRGLLRDELDQARKVAARLTGAARRLSARRTPAQPTPAQPAPAQPTPAQPTPAPDPSAGSAPTTSAPTNGAAVTSAVSPSTVSRLPRRPVGDPAPTNGAAVASNTSALPRRPVGDSPILRATTNPDEADGTDDGHAEHVPDGPPRQGRRSNASSLVGFTSPASRRQAPHQTPPATSNRP
jgi:hypothetical protein